MAPPTFPLMILAFFSVMGFIFFKKYYNRLQLINTTPGTPISSLKEGVVAVTGKPKAKNNLTSPISSTPCVWYRLLIERTHDSSPSSVSNIIHEEISSETIKISDGTGVVKVRLKGKDISLDIDTQTTPSEDPLNPKTKKILKQQGIGAKTILLQRPTLIEYIITEDDRIYVLGVYDRKQIINTRENPLIVSDFKKGTYLKKLKKRYKLNAILGATIGVGLMISTIIMAIYG